MIGIPYPQLLEEFKQLMAHYDTKNSFVLPELPSLRHQKLLCTTRAALTSQRPTTVDTAAIYQRCSAVFLHKATTALVPYPGTVATLATIKRYRPHVQIIALTDSPCVEAVWKITRLGLVAYFDGVYGLNTPPIVPTATVLQEIIAASKNYRGVTCAMPSSYEKPSTKGIGIIMRDFGLNRDEKNRVIYVGDNIKKDIALGKKAGVLTCWSEFGTPTDSPALRETLRLSPPLKIKQNVPNRDDLQLRPDVTLSKFSDILDQLF